MGLSSPLSLSLVSGISGYKWSPTGLNDSDSIMLFEVVSPLVISCRSAEEHRKAR